MLKQDMIQEIQDLKANGYSLGEAIQQMADRYGKAPSLPTARKYYNMDGVPDDLGESLKKDKAFDVEPFRSAIIDILTANPGCHISSAYDVLTERYVEGGGYEQLPGNAQTLRNYVRHLKHSGAVDLSSGKGRTYNYVPDTEPASQALIDFGQQECKGGLVVHFICLLLRFSRLLGVYAQDHRFNAEEACAAIYRFFAKCAGRPKQLVIDQDAVFVASETYGEVIETRVFKDFLTEQALTLWVCTKADPESKGPIENTVGFVKKNYFSARSIDSMDYVSKTLPGWVQRKNLRIHQATFMVPKAVFDEVERPALAAALPSVYESAPLNLISQRIGSMPYLGYRSCKYSLPQDMCYTTVYYRAVGDRLHIYDKQRVHVCTHDISAVKGKKLTKPEHAKEPSDKWRIIAERMRSKYNCIDFQHLINGFKKENGERHLAKQLGAVERLLDAERPSSALVGEVFHVCCRDWRYRFSQFEQVYQECKARRTDGSGMLSTPVSDVQKRSLESYQAAFKRRCAS
jgi:hypothetical protein